MNLIVVIFIYLYFLYIDGFYVKYCFDIKKVVVGLIICDWIILFCFILVS